MNGLMKRILFLLLVFVPAVAGADKVWTSGKGATWDCKKDPVVSIMAGKGTYTFKGACTSINVSGGKNKITVESADALNVSGATNTITIASVSTINLVGSTNKVTWKTAKTGDAPAISVIGKNNVVAQAGGAKPAPTTTAAADAKPAVGGSAIDCAKTATFMYAENDGTFTLTGKCDKILISGNNNKLKVESANTVLLSGNKNAVDAVAVNAIDTSGNENTVSYKKAVTTAGKTKISNTGNGNKISVAK